MKLYRNLDKEQRLTIPKDVLEQVGIRDRVEIDIIENNGKQAVTLAVPDNNNYNRKVLMEDVN